MRWANDKGGERRTLLENLFSQGDDGACWGIPFHQVLGTHYNPKHESLLIQFALGTIVVTGPKAWDFYDRFCSHKATLLKADGKDILAVTMALNARGDPDCV